MGGHKLNKRSSWWKQRWPRTTLIMVACVALIGGIVAAKFGWSLRPSMVYAALGSLILLLPKNRLGLVSIVLVFGCLGVWRGAGFYANISQFNELINQEVAFVGSIQDDPAIANNFQTEFHIEHLKLIDEDAEIPLPGRLRVRGFPNVKLSRGNIVYVSGKLRPSLGNRQGQISYAEIEVLAEVDNPIESLRHIFVAGTYSALPEPQASLGLGFLIGTRALLPDLLTGQLAATGLTHIVAVSGYNLTILVRFTRRLFARISKYIAFASSVGLVSIFMAVTGLSPSIVRASLVALLALGAWYYGRPVKPMMLILLPAAVTALINPTYVWYDLGWYLSFLAFFGVIMLAPVLTARVYGAKQPPALGQVFLETLSAQILTIPLIMYVFGQVSPISIPANMVVLPLVPAAMLTTLIAGIAGAVVPAIAGWFAWPANSVLSIIIKAVEWFANLPGTQLQFKIGFTHMLGLYVVILVVVAILRAKTKLAPNYSVVR